LYGTASCETTSTFDRPIIDLLLESGCESQSVKEVTGNVRDLGAITGDIPSPIGTVTMICPLAHTSSPLLNPPVS